MGVNSKVKRVYSKRGVSTPLGPKLRSIKMVLRSSKKPRKFKYFLESG